MKSALFYSIILLLTACRTIEVDPPAPEFKGLEEMSSTEPSFLLIQTEMALKPYLKEADQGLDKKFTGKSEQCEGVSYTYHVLFRGYMLLAGLMNLKERYVFLIKVK